MQRSTRNIAQLLITSILPAILVFVGTRLINTIPEQPYIGGSVILIAFLSLYFSFYALKIRDNEKNLREINEKMIKMQKETEINEKLLNSLRDISLLEEIKKGNKK
tara:strand:+ start:38 stop:355 length:318 start_codon:yes stop_codon:yes gene_type:complete